MIRGWLNHLLHIFLCKSRPFFNSANVVSCWPIMILCLHVKRFTVDPYRIGHSNIYGSSSCIIQGCHNVADPQKVACGKPLANSCLQGELRNIKIRINDVHVVLAMLGLVSRISHYSPVTSLIIGHL